MKVLVLNCGSSSVKYQMIEMDHESVLARGRVERIGLDDALLVHQPVGKPELRETGQILEHVTAIRKALEALLHPVSGVITDVSEVKAVGHRTVHGGEYFTGSVLVTDEVKEVIGSKCAELAPLHNPPNLAGIVAAQALMPGVPQVAVFDTAFHSAMPRKAFLYAIPYVLYERYKVRRYGFHGTSHHYVSTRAAQLMGKPIESLKIVTCHLGNGASVAAIQGGRCIDTSMGFTPLAGLVMGSRSGSLDPAAVLYVMSKEDLSVAEALTMLNKHSGVLGLSGVSSDMRELEAAIAAGNRRAKDAYDVYVYRITKYIGAYAAALNGVDCIVFTAGVGENNPQLVSDVCSSLTHLGVKIDPDRTAARKVKERECSSADSRVKVYIIPTNEELVIARETLKAIGAAASPPASPPPQR